MNQSFQISPANKCFSPIQIKPPTKLDSNLKYTNDPQSNDIQKIRNSIRKNQIDHKNFNPIYTTKEGEKYYRGIYTKNNEYFEPLIDRKTGDNQFYDLMRKTMTTMEFKKRDRNGSSLVASTEPDCKVPQ